MGTARAFSAPVVVTIAGEQSVLPKIIMEDVADVAVRVSEANKTKIEKYIKDAKRKAMLIAGAEVESLSADPMTIRNQAFTAVGSRAIWDLTEEKIKARGRTLLSASQRAALLKEAEGAEISIAPDASSVEMLFKTQDPEWLCNIACAVSTPAKVEEEATAESKKKQEPTKEEPSA
jgi:hypothetical protein